MMRSILALALLAGSAAVAEAQSGTTRNPNIVERRFHRVHLRNGNVIDGQFLRFTKSGVLMKLRFGEMEIRSDLVARTGEGKLFVEIVKIRSLGEQHEIKETPPRKPEGVERRDPFTRPTPPRPPETEKPTVVSTDMRENVDKILRKMTAADEDSRVELIQELIGLGEEAAIYIAESLDRIPESIRSEAAEALSGIQSPKAMPTIVKLLGHKDAAIRTQALNVIGGMDDPGKANYIRPMLRDTDAIVRGAAILMLERMDDRASFTEIAALTIDSEKAVRTQALTTLYNMAKEHEEEAKLLRTLRSRTRQARGEARAEIVTAMGNLKILESWTDLVPFLRDSSPQVRQAAAVALTRTDAKEAGPDIVEQVEAERDPWARVYLCTAVQKYRLRAAIRPLIEWLTASEKEVRQAAGQTLKLLTGQSIPNEYEKWLDWWNSTQNNR